MVSFWTFPQVRKSLLRFIGDLNRVPLRTSCHHPKTLSSNWQVFTIYATLSELRLIESYSAWLFLKQRVKEWGTALISLRP